MKIITQQASLYIAIVCTYMSVFEDEQSSIIFCPLRKLHMVDSCPILTLSKVIA